jgi:hypothetical protein
MPILVLLAVLVGLLFFFVLGVPLSLILRYRAGTMRRLARGWVVKVNLALLLVSIALFFAGATVTSFWIPRALADSAIGLAAGCALGALGLAATRWEPSARGLFFTPSRWLVLVVTLVVAVRITYGLWRAWHTISHGAGGDQWLDAFGVPESLAAGAIVLGYYLAYLVGLTRRVAVHARASAFRGR